MTQQVIGNFGAINDTLSKIIDGETNVDHDSLVEAHGLRVMINQLKFIFCAFACKTLLGLLAPVDKLLQSRECNITKSFSLIESAKESVQKCRNDNDFLNHIESATSLINDYIPNLRNVPSLPKRRKTTNAKLNNSVVLSTTGQSQSGDNIHDLLKSGYYEAIDIITTEMARRFTNNEDIYSAANAFDTSSDYFLQLSALKCLQKKESV